MERQDELQIIERISRGETHLFSLFLDRYGNAIYSLIVRIVVSREDAEELVQDTFLKAFKKIDTFKGECSFSTWLFRIAYNTAVSATRKSKMEFPSIDEAMIARVPDDAPDMLFEEDQNELLLDRLQEALLQLNAEETALIALYYNEGKSVSQIADILSVSSDNVKIKLYRVRKKLYLLINNTNDYATR
jgi:RNA polymerase sigma-70 factor (ECF subfamily)